MKKTISNKKLSLNKETLRKLTDIEASQVNGGAVTIGHGCVPRPTIGCSTSPPKYLC